MFETPQFIVLKLVRPAGLEPVPATLHVPHIVMWLTNVTGGSTVILSTGQHLYVQETAEEIDAMIDPPVPLTDPMP
jgi:hypothetical protein